MKKLFIFLSFFMAMILYSCEDAKTVQDEVTNLRRERYVLRESVRDLSWEKESLQKDVLSLEKVLGERRACVSSGKEPKYILKLKLKQSHVSLDIGTHIKDAMNAIEFEMPVDKEFYDSVSEDTEIVDDFRVGSLVINGSFGSWEMRVVGKEIR